MDCLVGKEDGGITLLQDMIPIVEAAVVVVELHPQLLETPQLCHLVLSLQH
jgi:hypothetical protein